MPGDIHVKIQDQEFWIQHYGQLLPKLRERGLEDAYVEQVRQDYPKALKALASPGAGSHAAVSWLATISRIGFQLSPEVFECLESLLENPGRSKSRWSEEEQRLFAIHGIALLPSTPPSALERAQAHLFRLWRRSLDAGDHVRSHDARQTMQHLGAHPRASVKLWKALLGCVHAESVDAAMAASEDAWAEPALRSHLLATRHPSVRKVLLERESVRRDGEALRVLLAAAGEDRRDMEALLMVAQDREAWIESSVRNVLLEKGDDTVLHLLAQDETVTQDEDHCLRIMERGSTAVRRILCASPYPLRFQSVREAVRASRDGLLLWQLLRDSPIEEYGATFAALHVLGSDQIVRAWAHADDARRAQVGRGHLLALIESPDSRRDVLGMLENMATISPLPLRPTDLQQYFASGDVAVRERALRLLGQMRTAPTTERPRGAARTTR